MASTTEQRMALEDAVCAVLDAGDSPEEVREGVEAFIESWQIDNRES